MGFFVITLLIFTLVFFNRKPSGSTISTICSCTYHHSIQDCYKDLWNYKKVVNNSNIHSSRCEIVNSMFYSQQIRKNNSKTINYKKFYTFLKYLCTHKIDFPNDCRHIGSYLTNIVQCSKDPAEAAWAQAANVYIQMEKLHIAFGKKCEYLPKNEFEQKISIFEFLSNYGNDLFRNVFMRDMKGMKRHKLVFFLYKQAMKVLLTEKLTLTYHVVHANKANKKAVNFFTS